MGEDYATSLLGLISNHSLKSGIEDIRKAKYYLELLEKDLEKPKMTKQEATQNIKNYKDITAYFDGTFSLEDFQNMMRYRFGFGEAETMVISSALVKVGAFAK